MNAWLPGAFPASPTESFLSGPFFARLERMNEPDQVPPARKYKWPRYVAAGVLLGFALAVLWMWFEVRHVEQERDVNGPLPAQR